MKKTTTNVKLSDLKADPIGDELAASEKMRPYVEYFKAHIKGEKTDSTLSLIRDLPMESRYIWRITSALKWAFADFDSESARLDYSVIDSQQRNDIAEELEHRLQQLFLLLEVFKSHQ